MKIHFKSINKSANDNNENIIEFNADLEKDFEDGFEVLTFKENRNGKIITNRIEYNDDTLRIYSGVSSLTCKLNTVIKNDFVVEGMSQTFFIYTKMHKMETSSKNKLIFEYKISSNENDFENHTTLITLELKIMED